MTDRLQKQHESDKSRRGPNFRNPFSVPVSSSPEVTFHIDKGMPLCLSLDERSFGDQSAQ